MLEKEIFVINGISIFLSDGTGVTSETFGLAINSQLDGMDNFEQDTIPFVRTNDDCISVIKKINSYSNKYKQIIIYSTIADPNVRLFITKNISYPVIDLYTELLPYVAKKLNKDIVCKTGRLHAEKKDLRSKAIDFALSHDDGQITNLDKADIILLGLSRSGKTPTCMWMALHYGIFAANYPITEDDFQRKSLPKDVIKNIDRCVLLITKPERLSEIRSERYKNSKYSSLENCLFETRELLKLTHISSLPTIDVTNKSVEEIAAHSLNITNIHPRGRF